MKNSNFLKIFLEEALKSKNTLFYRQSNTIGMDWDELVQMTCKLLEKKLKQSLSLSNQFCNDNKLSRVVQTYIKEQSCTYFTL